jgi:hypothetical protein
MPTELEKKLTDEVYEWVLCWRSYVEAQDAGNKEQEEDCFRRLEDLRIGNGECHTPPEIRTMLLTQLEDERKKRQILEQLVTGALADHERKGYETKLMGLRDGLSLWQREATEAKKAAKNCEDLQSVIDSTAAVLEELAPEATGELAHRVRAAIEDAYKRGITDCPKCVNDEMHRASHERMPK